MVERSNDTETLPLRPFCRGCIIATRGYDFRKGQRRDPQKILRSAPSYGWTPAAESLMIVWDDRCPTNA